ncbi:MAG: PAS domain-containing sensor histidine kinase [Candidatus Cloacimonetes bacterium]|nr:PAS domain-containing sensor histidine kinase [Candidatus Cloacimonadota bacterium]
MEKQTIELQKKLVDISKHKSDHLEFIHAVHQLLSEELKLTDSVIILRIDDYFLKSTFNGQSSEYWNYRTNKLNDQKRFARLTNIVLKEIDFDPNHCLQVDIIYGDELSGHILSCNPQNLKLTKKMLVNSVDHFYLICRSLFRQYQLNERVKELSCLQSISKLVETAELNVNEFLDKIVKLLPPAMQFPEQAQARILYEKKEFRTEVYEESELTLKAVILLNKLEVGFVEVSYPPELNKSTNNPFLKEERGLIETIAQELSFLLEKKRSEEERLQLEKQLRHADRLATLGQLSAGIAHEINEPLAGILGLAQLLEKNSSLDNQAQNDLENIVSASLHAREVVKKLMLFARQMPSVRAELNLNEAVSNATFFLESRCRKNMVKIDLDLKKKIPSIIADSSQIHQVLINLIVNSLQAMPNGGIINIKTFNDEQKVFLECSDTGIGMSKAVISKIFHPFFTTKKVNEGTGLGLSVVHGIIYSHSGEINVSSQPGKGAKFLLSFPQSN